MPKAAASVIRVAVDAIREGNVNERGLELTDITPRWCLVYGITGPYDGIHKLIEACQRGPHHVVACTSIPCFQVPWQRDKDEEEAETGHDWEKRKGRIDHLKNGGKFRWEMEERKESDEGGRALRFVVLTWLLDNVKQKR